MYSIARRTLQLKLFFRLWLRKLECLLRLKNKTLSTINRYINRLVLIAVVMQLPFMGQVCPPRRLL